MGPIYLFFWQNVEASTNVKPSRSHSQAWSESYTFASYFKIKFSVAEILQELGVTFEVTPIVFKQPSQDLGAVVEALKTRLENCRQRVRLTSEAE